ncbi:MAG: 1,2-oxophytodienoate reductase [Hydrocarboniphaga sp.]|uniref:oxidoreductase n=1 Tax=Hydrocarboniphaga sp. TaxID=2033016 RepID=UPI002620D0E2|nr:12-oxophytodienoate reductase [Hydrocarboniphaga sp.]MDB5971375.1 1,2-oxophytodienoate reductase [Hydrocarboniphaga sp.]
MDGAAVTDAVNDSLLTPFSLAGVSLRNRYVMSPMTREFSSDGVPGDGVAGYYERRARHGFGLIVTEGIGVDDAAAVDKPGVPLLAGAASIAGWKRVTDRVHAAGGVIVAQLWHQGPLRDPRGSRHPQIEALRPSGIWGPAQGLVSISAEERAYFLPETRPMSESEIGEVILAYGRAAAAAVAAGFDGVELHGGHGYLLDSFMWAQTNRRVDRWGGDARARSSFAAEVVHLVRGAIGLRPLMYRFSQHKQQDYKARLAQTPDELGATLEPLVEAGVDVFDASSRSFDLPAFEGSPMSLAGWARRLTGRPVMAVGGVGLGKPFRPSEGGGALVEGVDNLDRVRERFAAGEFDLIGVGRAALNDPRWIERIAAGEPPLAFDPANLLRLT